MLLEIDDKTWKDICEDIGFKYTEDSNGGYYKNSIGNLVAVGIKDTVIQRQD